MTAPLLTETQSPPRRNPSAVDQFGFAVAWTVWHWRAVLIGWLMLVAALPVAAPIPRASGRGRPTETLVLLYRPLSHPRPGRSIRRVRERMALCQRDRAIFPGFGITDLARSVSPRFMRIPQIPRHLHVLLVLTIVIDGGSRFGRLSDSVTSVRLLMGALLGIASVEMSLPALDGGVTSVRRGKERRGSSHAGAAQGSEP